MKRILLNFRPLLSPNATIWRRSTLMHSLLRKGSTAVVTRWLATCRSVCRSQNWKTTNISSRWRLSLSSISRRSKTRSKWDRSSSICYGALWARTLTRRRAVTSVQSHTVERNLSNGSIGLTFSMRMLIAWIGAGPVFPGTNPENDFEGGLGFWGWFTIDVGLLFMHFLEWIHFERGFQPGNLPKCAHGCLVWGSVGSLRDVRSDDFLKLVLRCWYNSWQIFL